MMPFGWIFSKHANRVHSRINGGKTLTNVAPPVPFPLIRLDINNQGGHKVPAEIKLTLEGDLGGRL